MKLVFTPSGWNDYLWFQAHDKRLLKRINQLIPDTLRSPFGGIGKPEPLKDELSGFWSRRIDEQHRMVYSATETEVTSSPAGITTTVPRRSWAGTKHPR